MDSASADSPSYFTGGELGSISVDISFTPMGGAAATIESSNPVNRFLIVGALSENADGSGTIVAADYANLTTDQQMVDMTDGVTVTWNNLEFEVNLTDTDCGNGTILQYYCVAIMPFPTANWGSVDYANASACLSIGCKGKLDIIIHLKPKQKINKSHGITNKKIIL